MFGRITEQLLRVFTNTEVPKPVRELSHSDTDESYDYNTDSDTDIRVDNPLLSNPFMPIFDMATGTLEPPTPPIEIEKKEIIGILDRTDRLGGHLLLGKKNVAVTSIEGKLVVGKWWGENTVVGFEKDKQIKTFMDICRHYNIAIEDCKDLDRKLKYMEMGKSMQQKFLLSFEQQVRDMILEDLMICFTNMCDRYSTPEITIEHTTPQSLEQPLAVEFYNLLYHFSYSICKQKKHNRFLLTENTALRFYIEELRQEGASTSTQGAQQPAAQMDQQVPGTDYGLPRLNRRGQDPSSAGQLPEIPRMNRRGQVPISERQLTELPNLPMFGNHTLHPVTVNMLNVFGLDSHYIFKENSTMEVYLLSKRMPCQSSYTLRELLNTLKIIIRDEKLFNIHNPAMIVADPALATALGKEIAYVSEVREIIYSQLTRIPQPPPRWLQPSQTANRDTEMAAERVSDEEITIELYRHLTMPTGLTESPASFRFHVDTILNKR
jgi:hypothetical protein